MLPVIYEPTISAGERPQTYALDRAATGTGIYTSINLEKYKIVNITKSSVLGSILTASVV
jgi:hypothetical protein